MKRLLAVVIVMVLVLCVSVQGQVSKKLSATLTIKLAAADTAAASYVWDTGYSDVTLLGYDGFINSAYSWYLCQFYWRMRNAATAVKDSNFTNDTFFVALQTSPSSDPSDTIWTTHLLDTSIVQDSGWTTQTYNKTLASAPTQFGPYARLRVIRRDSLEATGQTIVNRDFSKVVDLFVIGR